MFRRSLSKTVIGVPARFAGGIGAKAQKLGDKTHIETVIVAVGQYLNTANVMTGAFCKVNEKEPVGIFSEKTRPIVHEYSKDLYCHLSFKNEDATGKGIFLTPPKGHFYRIDSDVLTFDPANNKINLQDKSYTYDHLILAADTSFDWSKVGKMEEALKDYWNSKVVSSAQVNPAKMIWRGSLDFRGGNFVYALPKSPSKNEGTSHFLMLKEQFDRDKPVQGQWYKSNFIVTTPDSFIHRVPWINDKLLELSNKKGIEVRYNLQLQEIRFNSILAPHRVSEFVYLNTKTGQTEVIEYGSAYCYPEVKVSESVKPFADSQGFVDVDKFTLQSTKYSNVFALGEATNLPTINNSISVLNQAKVIAGNLGDLKKGMKPHYVYDGTSATPIFTGWQKMIMPGFRYGWEEVNTFMATDTSSPLASIKQKLSFKMFKRYEKKWFDKKMKGKIYGPPRWTKYVKPNVPEAHTSSH